MTAPEILALTLRAEAGDRPVRAIEALAALVVNRARQAAADARRPAPASPRAAAAGAGLAGAAGAGLPGALPVRLLDAAAPAPGGAAGGDRGPRTAPLAICRRVAARAAAGALPDPTAGATHWHAAEVLPGWALGQVPSAEIGGLVFYRLG